MKYDLITYLTLILGVTSIYYLFLYKKKGYKQFCKNKIYNKITRIKVFDEMKSCNLIRHRMRF